MRGFAFRDFAFIEKLALRVGALIFLACPCLPQTHPALPNASHKLEIIVTDENGVAVRSALVLLNTAPQASPLHCETDFAGRCTFTGIPAATFQLRVEKQIRQVRLGAERAADILQQRGANNAATPPNPRHGFKIQTIPVFV